jgi:hypothetical protein
MIGSVEVAALNGLVSDKYFSRAAVADAPPSGGRGVQDIHYAKQYDDPTSANFFISQSGAVLGDDNYSLIQFNSTADIYRFRSSDRYQIGDGSTPLYNTVAQWSFDGIGGGYVVAVATESTGALSLADGKQAIIAASASVPEPSAVLLGLLALGAATMPRRRRRAA